MLKNLSIGAACRQEFTLPDAKIETVVNTSASRFTLSYSVIPSRSDRCLPVVGMSHSERTDDARISIIYTGTPLSTRLRSCMLAKGDSTYCASVWARATRVTTISVAEDVNLRCFSPYRKGHPVMRAQVRQGLFSVGALVVSCLWAGPAMAGIISTTGQIDLLSSPPASVKIGKLQSNTDIFTFTEQTGVSLSKVLDVDITTPGTYMTVASLTPGTLSVGTPIESYFLHTDPPNNSSKYDGSVTFSTPILGVIVISRTLSNSDAELGASGTTYPTGDIGRGLELTSGQDFVTLSSDLKTLTVHFFTHGNVDEVRIVTAAVPEPRSLLLAGCGLVILAAASVCRVRGRRIGWLQ